ncbi:MAG: choice-of-anchor Q domain-containing protein, partial [Gimesia sp.]
LVISDDLTIAGLGADQLTLDGNGDSRIFFVDDGDADITINVEINGLTVTNGYADYGGAILSHENLSLSNSEIYLNEASVSGGGLYHKDGLLSLTNCYFVRNVALQNGGAINALNSSVIINDSIFSNNSAQFGGALFVTALQIPMPEIFIQNSTFTENTALNSGGAIYSGNSIIYIEDSVISKNSADSKGGGLDNSRGHMTVKNSTVTENIAMESGGGIYTGYGVISVINSTIFQNSAIESGGGIFSSGGNINLTNSTLSGNSANLDGGGVYLSGSRLLYRSSPAILFCGTTLLIPDVMSSLITSSLSPSVSDIVELRLSSFSPPLRTIETFRPKFNIENCTIVNNSALRSGGGIFKSGNSYDVMVNSIIAGNTAETYRQVSSSFTTRFNIIQDSIEGLLDPVLRDNGGPTKTHALVEGSAAINAGSNAAAINAGLTDDQRGVGNARIIDGTVDIGAYEGHITTPEPEAQTPVAQIDWEVVFIRTTTSENGERISLPENEPWIDGWGEYWVEIWISTPETTDLGILSASLDLNYITELANAISIEYGAAFTQNQTGTINDLTGTIENLSAETSQTDVGDDRDVLFARIKFESIFDALDPAGMLVDPQTLEFSISQKTVTFVGGAISEESQQLALVPHTQIETIPEPVIEEPAVDFANPTPSTNTFNAIPGEIVSSSDLTLIEVPDNEDASQFNHGPEQLLGLENESTIPDPLDSSTRDLPTWEEDTDSFFSELTDDMNLIDF